MARSSRKLCSLVKGHLALCKGVLYGCVRRCVVSGDERG